MFYAALIANGWFLRVKSFAYSPGVGSVPSRFKKAFSRWALFLLFWVVAMALLPTLLVAVAFAGWFVWIVRDLRKTLDNLDTQVELVHGG